MGPLKMPRGADVDGIGAPVYVAIATLCQRAPDAFQNSAEIPLGQKKLVSIWNRVMPGPNTDQTVRLKSSRIRIRCKRSEGREETSQGRKW
jgi:hypothetical protein